MTKSDEDVNVSSFLGWKEISVGNSLAIEMHEEL